jgi:2-isopropylmalate synthase
VQSKASPSALDAQKETRSPRTFGGYGADTDIIVASAKAYLAALNKVLVEGEGRIAAAAAVPVPGDKGCEPAAMSSEGRHE